VPVAYVTVRDGGHASEDDLRAWAAERVPERAAAPKHVDIVDTIPLTPIGKPFKNELRRRAAERAAREALPAHAHVTAELRDGTVEIVVDGASDDEAREALAPFGMAWRTT
jgi:fatty-acyl-CoA synthase